VNATCPICVLGWGSNVPDFTGGLFHSRGRELVAEVCEHVMKVHNGGALDAWRVARDVDPFTCMLWEAEERTR
jgi:hypothetical protein